LEFKWDLRKTRKGNDAPYKREDLLEDKKDKRIEKRVFVDYRPLLEASQVEWRVWIESYYPKGKPDRMVVGVISMAPTQQESMTLADEYDNLHPEMRHVADCASDVQDEPSISDMPCESSISTQKNSRFGDTPRSETPQSRPDVESVQKKRARITASPTPSLGLSQTTYDDDDDDDDDEDSDFKVRLPDSTIFARAMRAGVLLARV
jgi:hypothetical protein